MSSFSPLAEYALNTIPDQCLGTALLSYAVISCSAMFEPELPTLLHVNKTIEERAVLPVIAFIPAKRYGYTRLVYDIYLNNIERVKRILEVAPDSAKIVNKRFGYTPLHIACSNYGVPVEILEMLLEAYPEAAMIRDQYGYVPLHWEFNTGSISLEHINALLEVAPQAAKVAAKSGYTPLHLACRHHSEKEGFIHIIEALLEAAPEAATMKGNNDFTPLNLACNAKNPKLDIITALLDIAPECVNIPCHIGVTPLASAFSSKASPEAIAVLKAAGATY